MRRLNSIRCFRKTHHSGPAAIFAAFALCATSIHAQSAGRTVIDLRTYGWQAPDQTQKHHPRVVPSVVVDHKGRVVIAYTVRSRTGLVTRDVPSLDLQILRFSPDGKLDLSLSLPTTLTGGTGLYLSDADQIMAKANGDLHWFEPGVPDEGKGNWKVLVDCHAQWQSHSRRTMLIYFPKSAPPLEVIHFGPRLETTRCGTAGPFGSPQEKIQNMPQSITDEFGYFHGLEAGRGFFTDRWPLCHYEQRVELPIRVVANLTAVNDDAFVAVVRATHNHHSDQEVFSSDGQVRFRTHLEKHETCDSFRNFPQASERGDFVAADIVTIRGENWTLDIGGQVVARRIAVYEVNAGKEVGSFPANPKFIYRSAFALSPDGRTVAVLEDGKLTVWSVPPRRKSLI